MRNPTFESDLDRFLDKIKEEDHGYETLCWQWTASASNGRYGDFGASYLADGKRYWKMIKPHKWLYESLHGPIPERMELDHLCRNTFCCNPDHLELVTHRENVSRGVKGDLKPGRTSKYRGVSWDKQMNKWITKIKLNGKQYNLGYYKTEEEGHQVYLETLARYEKDGSVPASKKEPKTSRYKGVSWDKQRQKWVAGVRMNGSRVALGRFDTEEEAYQEVIKYRPDFAA